MKKYFYKWIHYIYGNSKQRNPRYSGADIFRGPSQAGRLRWTILKEVFLLKKTILIQVSICKLLEPTFAPNVHSNHPHWSVVVSFFSISVGLSLNISEKGFIFSELFDLDIIGHKNNTARFSKYIIFTQKKGLSFLPFSQDIFKLSYFVLFEQNEIISDITYYENHIPLEILDLVAYQ